MQMVEPTEEFHDQIVLYFPNKCRCFQVTGGTVAGHTAFI
jgi:hypothetical protein